MPECAFMAKCPFFNNEMGFVSAMADIYKQRYCKTDFARCARFVVREALGPGTCPTDLFPNQIERARELIALRA